MFQENITQLMLLSSPGYLLGIGPNVNQMQEQVNCAAEVMKYTWVKVYNFQNLKHQPCYYVAY